MDQISETGYTPTRRNLMPRWHFFRALSACALTVARIEPVMSRDALGSKHFYFPVPHSPAPHGEEISVVDVRDRTGNRERGNCQRQIAV